MPEVTFQPDFITVSVPEGELLLEAAKLAGISAETPCGGKGTCGKCLVRVMSGAVDFSGNIREDMRVQGWVLICQARVGSEPVVVNTFYDSEAEQGKFHDHMGDFLAVDKNLMPKSDDTDFIVKSARITVAEPNMGDGLSDFDRLKIAVTGELKCRDVKTPLSVLPELPEVLRESRDTILYYYMENDALHIAGIASGAGREEPLALCVDIGTTTVALSLVDKDGRVRGSKSGYNAQIACGLDVISRINYAKTPQRRLELKNKVLETVNAMTRALCEEHGAAPGSIMNVSIAANTTMVHLLLGIVPEYIRLSPYTPAIYSVPLFTAGEIGLVAAPGAPVYISPSVGSYVGGDITAGILCTPIAAKSEDMCLFIDIGTNGEIVLGNNDFMMSCACSAGPAFEGGGISCGMRASVGAIERVMIDPDTGKARLSVIGDVPPAGICGSGMISLVAELFKNGLIDPSGKLSGASPHIIDKRYVLDAGNEDENRKRISVSEADINNLMRAKAAIFSACRTMLLTVGMDFDDLARVYIAGGFGRYLNLDDAAVIGLLPPMGGDRLRFLGNSSLTGAYMTLISEKHRRLQAELSAQITYIDLSCEPSYMDEYMAALFLPHTDIRLFEPRTGE